MTLFIAWSSQTLDQAKIENKACSVRTTRSQSRLVSCQPIFSIWLTKSRDLTFHAIAPLGWNQNEWGTRLKLRWSLDFKLLVNACLLGIISRNWAIFFALFTSFLITQISIIQFLHWQSNGRTCCPQSYPNAILMTSICWFPTPQLVISTIMLRLQ